MEKREEVRFLQEVYDADNKQQFFHPKISHYEKFENLDRKAQGYPSVHEQLYKEARIFKDKKSNLKKKSARKENQELDQQRK